MAVTTAPAPTRRSPAERKPKGAGPTPIWASTTAMIDETAPSRPKPQAIWLAAMGVGQQAGAGETGPAAVVSREELRAGGAYDLITLIPLTTNPKQRLSGVNPSFPAGGGNVEPSVALGQASFAGAPSRLLRRLDHLDDQRCSGAVTAQGLVEGSPGGKP